MRLKAGLCMTPEESRMNERQLDVHVLHCVRERTALINHLRAIPLERRITVPQGRHRFEMHLGTADEQTYVGLNAPMRISIDHMRARTRRRDGWRPFPAPAY